MSLRLALPAVLLLSACSTERQYPSLLPRAGEKQGFEEPVAVAPGPVAADPALDARIAAARRKLAEDVAAFDRSAAQAERLVAAARGSAAGSEAWLNAQVALAELDARRSATLEGATDLEQAASDRAVDGQPDYSALDATIAALREAGAAQTARIGALQDALPEG